VKKMGIKVLSTKGTKMGPGGKPTQKTVTVRSRATGVERQIQVRGLEMPDGEKIFPQASFDFNPGKAAYQPDLGRYDFDIARDFATATAAGPYAKMFFEGKIGGKLATAAVDPGTAEILKKAGKQVTNKTVWLHADRAAHIRKHTEITSADLPKTRDIIENGEIVTNPKGEADFLFFRRIEGVDHVIPLQVGKQGQGMNSFYKPSPDPEKYREKKREIGKVLRKEKN
jgi:hypothetical protein